MRNISTERLNRDAHRVLENPFWISGLHSGVNYSRLHDDDDGTREGVISVYFEPHTSDAFIEIDIHHGPSLRFRTQLGGTSSPRVYNALMLLAEAIRLDNEEKPGGNPEVYNK